LSANNFLFVGQLFTTSFMSLYSMFSVLIVLSALFAYLNYRFIKLPSAIGLMTLALATSLLLIVIGIVYPDSLKSATTLLHSFDFSELLLGSMLSFMLFAGSIHIDLRELKQQKLSVFTFSTFSVIISTFLIGGVLYYLLGWLNVPAQFIHCLLFGALISPTDPIAVLSILKEAKIPKSLEMKIAGESLFNDGVAIVVFLTILQVAEQPDKFQWSEVLILFFREAVGGILLGLLIGYGGYKLMKSIDNYKVEVLITLSVVMGGYSLADWLHVSGPLAMVAAGILIGNHAKEQSMSAMTANYVNKFWELVDEILNAILFVLIGLYLLIIHFIPIYFLIGTLAITVVLCARYISVFIPAQLIKLREVISQRTILILTWGGLRGGISIALALSLKPEMQKNLWVTLTYFVVAFSILVQGLTIGKLARLKSKEVA
jgi:CPA1 family monovalent cation:H+ antiporter